MNESNDSEGGRRASQDRRRSPRDVFVAMRERAQRDVPFRAYARWARDKTIGSYCWQLLHFALIAVVEFDRWTVRACARWVWDKINNEGSDKFWERRGRLVIGGTVGAGAALVFQPLLGDPWIGKAGEEHYPLRYYSAALLVAAVGALMAAWRGRQSERGLRETQRQIRLTEKQLVTSTKQAEEAKFASYLQMAASESESTARTGFALLRILLPELSEGQFKVAYQLIISSLSLRKQSYSDIKKRFDSQLTQVPLDKAIEEVRQTLRKERSLAFRRDVISFWKEYTKVRLSEVPEDEVDIFHSHLFVEGEKLQNLNFSGLTLSQIRPVKLEMKDGSVRKKTVPFSGCLFLGTQFHPGSGLIFQNSMCVDATIFTPHLFDLKIFDLKLYKSLDEDDKHLAFIGTHLCKSWMTVEGSSHFAFRGANVTGVTFSCEESKASDSQAEGIFWQKVAPFAKHPQNEVYWITPAGLPEKEVEDYKPVFLLPDVRRSASSEMSAFWDKVRRVTVPFFYLDGVD